jgi:hypothetical protein
MDTSTDAILGFLNDNQEINLKELEVSLGLSTGAIRRSGKLPMTRLGDLIDLLTDRYGYLATDKTPTDEPKVVTDENRLTWKKGRHGWGEEYFVPNSDNPTLTRKRWGNFIPDIKESVMIPRYRDGDGLWRRVEGLSSEGEVFSDDVGDYMIWKSKRVYTRFSCL